ncbi:hypothetical protein [Sorangium sp. So ce131]|uniref:hypothetical protein n=1 Tax=Sorangium sp. So ce131 TaxID=3133282 RepID=UPI003F6338A6
MTDSTFVRGVIAGMDAPALNPLSGRYEVFAKGQLIAALRKLDASPLEERAAVALVEQLRQTLGQR